jgi:hypothetical protein
MKEEDMLKFWSQWMGATVLGFVGGFIGVYLLVGLITGGEGPEGFGVPFEVFFPIWLGLAATAMATLQWLMIRRRSAGLVGWIPATAIGALIGIGALMLLVAVMGEPETILATVLSAALHGIVVGAIVGTAQWLVIRYVDPSRGWIKTNVLALVTAAVIGDTIGFYTDGGLGTMVIFALWQALVAPTLYRLMQRHSAVAEAKPIAARA